MIVLLRKYDFFECILICVILLLLPFQALEGKREELVLGTYDVLLKGLKKLQVNVSLSLPLSLFVKQIHKFCFVCASTFNAASFLAQTDPFVADIEEKVEAMSGASADDREALKRNIRLSVDVTVARADALAAISELGRGQTLAKVVST